MAGTVTQTLKSISRDDSKMVLTFAWTADASDGSVPSTTTTATITAEISGYDIVEVRTNPGTTAPTASYDIVLNDTDGIDLMGGSLANRSETASERAIPLMTTGVYGTTTIDSTVAMVLTGNSVHSATGTVKLFLER